MLNILSFFSSSWFNVFFSFLPSQTHFLTTHFAVANILWREEGNTIEQLKFFCILVNMKVGGGHLFRACCRISTRCRMFTILSRRIKVVFSPALKALSILLSSLHFKMFHSFVVPSDLFHYMFWRENIHTQGGKICMVENTKHLQNNRFKKNKCGFQ